ncbi:type II/IV secretion system family protein [Vibrio parahaemolyticus VPCR-2010]|uniref:ATPase, T2SS/T4P/T4SS family n=1 Tax=Vibrio parahaemolyticus TaxID=670 RepID=UPI00038E65AD|nr:type II/IV secretion system family protein [Vibrio parahaemolyticus VPCR-2010]
MENDYYGVGEDYSNFKDMIVIVDNVELSHFSPSTRIAYNSCDKVNSLISHTIDKYKVNKEINRKDFRVEFDDYVYRGTIMPSIRGDYVLLRRMPKEVWPLKQCFSSLSSNMSKALYKHLTEARLNMGGIIIVCGNPGNGKSTTSASIVKERLEIHGGHCNTIEDPCEMPLHGKIGESGYCIQREVSGSESFEDALRDTLRGYPTASNNILLLGEVRDPTVAELAVRSAIDGRLVITTFHSAGIIEAIKRLLNLSADKLGMSEASDLLASSLRVAIHQKVIGNTLKVTSLFDTDAVVGAIRDQTSNVSLEHLQTEILNQAKKINDGIPILTRSKSGKSKLSR